MCRSERCPVIDTIFSIGLSRLGNVAKNIERVALAFL